MALCKTMSELISRLNSYTLEELIEDLVLDNGKPEDVSCQEYIFRPPEDMFWSAADINGFGKYWNVDKVIEVCLKKGLRT